MEKKRDLLAELAGQAGCNFLSDLLICEKFSLLHALEGLCPEDYSIGDWEETAYYLTRQRVRFTSQREASRFLQRQLEREAAAKQP